MDLCLTSLLSWFRVAVAEPMVGQYLVLSLHTLRNSLLVLDSGMPGPALAHKAANRIGPSHHYYRLA